ncbi:MAG: prepilin peptidase [Alphaproteobacteria bacterium]
MFLIGGIYFKALIFFFFLTIMLWASIKDILTFTIPNKIPLFLLFLFLFFAFYKYLENPEEFLLFLIERSLIAISNLVLGIIIWQLGFIGGGDIKLFAVLGLWFSLKNILLMIVMTSFLGGVIALFLIFIRTFLKNRKYPQCLNQLMNDKNGIPYGVAICFSAIICFVIENFYKL